jgi:hypothetical protein
LEIGVPVIEAASDDDPETRFSVNLAAVSITLL